MAEAVTIPSPSVFLRASPPPSSNGEPSKSATATTTSWKDGPPPPPAPPLPPAKHARKPSAASGAKKPATSRKGSAAAVVDGVAKPKQSKSRNGCVTCKAKRLKCGEEKPSCAQCSKRNVECGGYKKDFKWRPFEETNIKVNNGPPPARQKRASPPHQSQPSPANSSNKATSPNSVGESRPDSAPRPRPRPAQPPTERSGHGHQRDDKPSPKDPPSRPQRENTISLPQRPAPSRRRTEPDRERHSTPGSPPKEQADPAPPPNGHDDGDLSFPLSQMDELSPFDITMPGQLPPTVASRPGLSPTLTEMLMPFSNTPAPGGDDMDDIFSLPPYDNSAVDVDPALLSQHRDRNQNRHQDHNQDRNRRRLSSGRPAEEAQALWAGRYNRMSRVSEDSASPDSQGGPFNRPINYIYRQPFFPEDSEEMLTFRFDRLTCGILSIFDGPSENPWRNVVWPLAQQSPALRHAITAMTAFHSSMDVPGLRVRGHEHKQASIRYIQEGIRDNSMTDHMAIATALCLSRAESWDLHTATGNSHIKGAQVLVKRSIADHQRRPLRGMELARLKFLCNAWVYMDVISRLTSIDSDESQDFDNTFLFSHDAPEVVMGDSMPGFGIDFGVGIDAHLDPLMGCANTLFPLIGRVANLVRRVCRSKCSTPVIITQANDLKLALEAWDPPEFIEPPEDPTCTVQHALQTAEAYRWATLLHLHQAVPELPFLPSAELSQKVFIYLATVPLVSRTVIVQIYPLLVAGCEALDPGYRQWVRERWQAMGQRMRVGIVEKCWTVTEEVWRRRDAYEAQPSSRRKLVATSELQPSRQRGVPLSRSRSDFEDSDPGRGGVVFSYVEPDEFPGNNNGIGGGGPVGSGRQQQQDQQNWSRRGRSNKNSNITGTMDAAYTVRGHLHWVGVMWDWGWESEFCLFFFTWVTYHWMEANIVFTVLLG
ncbi:hypothetical protein MBLNU230_g7575t1 [Neophaeotheca triangularis]